MSDRNVLEVTIEELRELVDTLVEEKLHRFLGDPDEGLELREDVKARLRKSLKSQAQGERGIPLEDVIKRFGLNSK